MSSKYTYDDVKKLFEERGYKLISTTYTRSTEKLEYECSNGHTGTVTFKNFKNRNFRMKNSAIIVGGESKIFLYKINKIYSNNY